jgi:thioredoxin-related protein
MTKKALRPAWPRRLLLVLMLWLAVPAQAAEFQYHDLEEALRLAEADNKLVMVFFWANWCVYCRQIRSEVFTDPGVHEVFDRDFLAVSVNIEEDPGDLAKKYRARALPTMVFLKPPDSTVVGFLPGAVDGKTFLRILNYLVENEKGGVD